MADNTVADLPKKNAAPAEAPKSLAATVQQVMTKAVTSPTDAKVDFAQGVNHISGDPQQKSAGPADAMQSLKASAEKSDDKEEIKAAYEADEKKDEKEKEEVKEVAKEDEKKDEVKEGEMPQAALDALKKKQDKEDTKEEKEEDKKKEEVKEDTVSEAEEKEDEKSAKEKVKDMDMKEDVAALTEGEDLSEEFKAKAATIFESAVKAKLVEEIEKLESEYETKVNERVSEVKEEIVDKVDAYLNYVVEEWMKENELAIEKGLRAEITEDFIGGLKSLFESHYINVPQEKYDVIENQAAEIEKLKEEVNKTIEKNVELNQKIAESTRSDIVKEVSADLAATEADKLNGLAESIEYKDADSFRKSVETLKNSYFPKAKASDNESNEVAENNAGLDLSESMAAYTAAISKTKKNPYIK